MSEFFLRQNVHYCLTDNGIVFLDLDKGKYLGVTASQSSRLRGLSESLSTEEPEVREMMEALAPHELFTTDSTAGKPFVQVIVEPANDVLFDWDTDGIDLHPAVAIRDVCDVLYAYAKARLELKILGVKRAVNRVHTRKLQACRENKTFDITHARELVARFQHIRSMVYTAHSHCLTDSLTLIEFLARRGIYPTWIIAARTHPFNAHSWVQESGFVFNDHPARTRCFVPMLAV